MKHIVLLIDSLVGGGAETTNVRLAKIFIEKGFNVTLIIMRNIIEIEYDKRLNIISLNYKKNKLPNFIRNYLYAQKLHKILHSLQKIDLMVGSLGLTHELIHIIEKKYKFYYAIHGTTTLAKLKNKKGLNYYLKRQELIKIYNHKRIICVSQGVKKDILSLKISPLSIDVIYNPFNFQEIRTKANEKIDFNFPHEYIVHVGRFAKVKRHDILIKAFSRIKNKEIKLVLVGDGEEKNFILKLVKDLQLEERVIFAGFRKNPFPVIKNAKLLVLSSDNEGFGNVLIEALILNTPIVSTNTLGAKEIMTDSLKTYLANTNDSKDLSRKINISLTSDLEKYYNLTQYEETTIINQYINLIKS